MATILMNNCGPALQITRHNGIGNTKFSYIIPYKDNLSLTATQELKQPARELFDWLKDSLMSLSDFAGGTIPAAIDTTDKLLDLLGYKLNQKGYYASAWGGSNPPQISLSLDFYRGMAGEYNSQIEVYNPILELFADTVPYSDTYGAFTLSSPMPSPANVLAHYASNLITSMIEKVATEVDKAGVAKASQLYTEKSAKVQTVYSSISSAMTATEQWFNSMKTWDVSFGWYNNVGGKKELIPFYTMSSMIVESSTISFSTMVEERETKYYPISGNVKLAMKGQDILTSYDVNINKSK